MQTGDRVPRRNHERRDLCRARGGVGRDDGQGVSHVGEDGVRGKRVRGSFFLLFQTRAAIFSTSTIVAPLPNLFIG